MPSVYCCQRSTAIWLTLKKRSSRRAVSEKKRRTGHIYRLLGPTICYILEVDFDDATSKTRRHGRRACRKVVSAAIAATERNTSRRRITPSSRCVPAVSVSATKLASTAARRRGGSRTYGGLQLRVPFTADCYAQQQQQQQEDRCETATSDERADNTSCSYCFVQSPDKARA